MRTRSALLGAALWLLCSGLTSAREPWVVLKDCRLVRSEASDADSFHVKAGGKEYIFRLYFVDAPETDMSIEDRVREQAKYFGLTPEQTITLGEHARRFTREKLAQPFTVRTCMQDAMGRSKMARHYAFVETSEGDLAELLTANGLARIHGAEAQPAGLRSPERYWDKLKRLEREAKQLKVGAWGAPSGRMTARSPKAQPKTGPNSFDAFFHPERLAAADGSGTSTPAETPSPPPAAIFPPRFGTSSPVSAISPSSSVSSVGGKLDVNAATSADLLAIPGIGPVLAQRIIEARPFQSADDLINVKGIGPKKFETIREHFR
jgi:competence protein ComEA